MIRRVLFSLIIINLISFSAFSQTEVSGLITSNTEWTLEGSPYILVNNVGVSPDILLIIQAGVSVQGNFDLLVKGKILVEGKVDNEVLIDNVRIFFKSTDLTNSKIEYAKFTNSGGVQLADENDHAQDLIKNSGTLTILSSSFKSNAYVRTKGNATFALLKVTDCLFENAAIIGLSPSSEKIELSRCEIINTTIISQSHNKGIHLIDSKILDSRFKSGCCTANINLSKCEVSNSLFSELDSRGNIIADSSTFINTIFDNGNSHIKISNSKFYIIEAGTSQIKSKTIEIENSVFEGNNNIDAINIDPNYFSDVYWPSNKIQNNTFIGYRNALLLDGTNSLTIKRNNFISIESYAIINYSAVSIDATENYWNTTDKNTISSKILDKVDDPNRGIVNFANFLTSLVKETPISTPKNLLKGRMGERVLLSWDENSESDLKGYKIYHKSNLSDPFKFLIDVGNERTHLAENINFDDLIVITSYSNDADGIGDVAEGNESIYSDFATPYFLSNLISPTLCDNDIIKIQLTSNYNFSSENSFIVQISEVDDEFLNPVDLDIISSTASLVESEFPEGYLYEKEYLLRVLSTETGVSSAFMKIIFNHNPVLDFETITTSCLNDPYEIMYTGSTEGESTWDFDGAQVISGSGFGPYKLKWLHPGEKVVRFSMNKEGCIKDKAFEITIAPLPAVPEICMVTVDEETSKNKIIWTNASENVKSFGIYRETNVAYNFSLIDIVDSNNTSYIDNQSFPDQVSNRYKISAIDNCDSETDASIFHKTIHLTINKGLGNSWNLIWNEYEGATFGTYQIFRSINHGNMELLTEVPSNLTSFTDLNPPPGILSYQITVINPNDCEGQENARINGMISSKSNIAKNIVTGLNNLERNQPIAVFPNPTSQKAVIFMEQFLEGEYSVKDLNGRLIKSGLLEQTFDIDFSDDPKGVYILTIKSKDGVDIKKIIKQ